MAATEPIDIVELGVGDAQAGLALSAEAGWNQNEADWRFFLAQGIVFGLRDSDRLVATAALLPYSAGNAWIIMVLAGRDAGWRHRLRPARLHADAAIAAAAAGEADAHKSSAAVVGQRTGRVDCAR